MAKFPEQGIDMLSAESILQKLEFYPRIPLAEFPTPLEHLPCLSARLRREVFIKRDDYLGPGLGGNKTRKLEYLLAEAKGRGLRKVVTYGGLQSNHARITAAAARKLGLEPHIFYFERCPDQMLGNLLINQILGAHMHFIPFGGGGDGSMTLEATNRLVHLLAWLQVGRHTFIPVGGHSWRGCLGYVRAAAEIETQARELGIERAHLVLAAGTGGTLAGLLAGLTLMNSSLRPLGIDVGKLWKGFPASLAHLTGEICARLGEKRLFHASEVPLIEGVYAAPKYGSPSPACVSAIKWLARDEGILLDPVYTGKAFAGLLDLLDHGRLGTREPIIFLHTGGLPALFAFDSYD
ncbi:MAG TPA: pyridoxal-phosphate dependent enzyme [Anaerolineales bacterium]|nr:pyridoxal-phosphate dependent enzyme [Anaerolineales bacterium]